MTEIPYHSKQKPFACGPAALRMAIQALIAEDVGEDLLIKLIGTSEKWGTPLSAFEINLSNLLTTICKELNIDNRFEFIIEQNGCASGLQKFQDTGYVVLLNYTKPDGQAHWAVLESLSDQYISLMDPDFGPCYKYEWHQFNWQGGSNLNRTDSAFVAIKYEDLSK